MKIHMYEHFPNFGDALNKYLWPVYFDKWLKRDDDILMFGIGTLLGQKIEHNGRVIVCGSGCGYEPDIESVKKDWKIFFVRGPRTSGVLKLPRELAITDPAILTPEYLPAKPKTSRIAFIPHWETSRNPLWKKICAMADIDYIDPLAPVDEVLSQISAAKMVITEAMHGAIIADAYRVPFIPVSTSARINHFKWQDWTDSLKISFNIEYLKPLGMSEVFRNITSDTKTAKRLRDALPQEYANSHIEKMDFSSAVINKIYTNAVPLKLRYRIDHYLMWKLGHRLDGYIETITDKSGFLRRHLEKSAENLLRLSAKPGWQSEESVASGKRSQIHEKIYEIQKFLGD